MQPFTGWDFSWLGDQMKVEPLPWDFAVVVLARARASSSLLDLGTGGGERLAALPYRPERTVATESWRPNVAVAEKRLRPLGVEVVEVEGARDNVAQSDPEQSGRLPFPDSDFELIASRHEAYVASEVARALAPGGWFVTEQAGAGNDDDFFRLLDLDPPDRTEPQWTLDFATAQLEAAGLRVVDSDEAEQTVTFADVGAIVWYLKAIPWAVPTFRASAFRERLAELHRRGPVSVQQQRFWLEALKPR